MHCVGISEVLEAVHNRTMPVLYTVEILLCLN
jgi:hypothetical protein